MRTQAVGEAAEAAVRILGALRSGDAARLDSELTRASGLCLTPARDSWAEERAELLEGVVSEIRERMAEGAEPRQLEPQVALLGHLAGI
ncbi:MAG TPA: hypothetical protein VF767_09815 [Bryobacteraceae bacterium]